MKAYLNQDISIVLNALKFGARLRYISSVEIRIRCKSEWKLMALRPLISINRWTSITHFWHFSIEQMQLCIHACIHSHTHIIIIIIKAYRQYGFLWLTLTVLHSYRPLLLWSHLDGNQCSHCFCWSNINVSM